jgi:hypothetical protein
VSDTELTTAKGEIEKLVKHSQTLNQVAYTMAIGLGLIKSPDEFHGDPVELLNELLMRLAQAQTELRITEGKVKDREDDITMWRARSEMAEAFAANNHILTSRQLGAASKQYRIEHPEVDWTVNEVSFVPVGGYQIKGHIASQASSSRDMCCCHPDQPSETCTGDGPLSE